MSQCIQGTIINASYPRSGHRLLRNILINYFGSELVFYESYSGQKIPNDAGERHRKTPNYIKTHDFDLQGRKELVQIFPDNRRYILQIRHPLEAITSYYEFSLKHKHLENDSEQVWRGFVEEKLEYWKGFVDTWLKEASADVCVVKYSKLIDDKREAVSSVITFLTKEKEIYPDKLDAAIQKVGFYQYVGDKESKKNQTRKLDQFKYYDKNYFTEIETALSQEYLMRAGIEPILI